MRISPRRRRNFTWRRSYPHIPFHLVSGNEDLIYDSLQKGLLDFGLVSRADTPRTYVFRRIPHGDAWGS